jgi:hypothetical protein
MKPFGFCSQIVGFAAVFGAVADFISANRRVFPLLHRNQCIDLIVTIIHQTIQSWN